MWYFDSFEKHIFYCVSHNWVIKTKDVSKSRLSHLFYDYVSTAVFHHSIYDFIWGQSIVKNTKKCNPINLYIWTHLRSLKWSALLGESLWMKDVYYYYSVYSRVGTQVYKVMVVCFTPFWNVILSSLISQMDFHSTKIHLGSQNWQHYISNSCIKYCNILH